MSRLFWKFFAAFWLGLALFSVATFWFASGYLERTSASSTRESARAGYLNHLQAAQRVADQQGEAGLKQWLRKLDFSEAIPFYLLNQSGEELLGRVPPEYLLLRLEREQNRRALSRAPRPPLHHHPNRPSPFMHGTVNIPGQGEYSLVADPGGITLTRILKRPRVIALPLLIAAISSALISLLLARYLTRPINQLRDATRQLARGEFQPDADEKLHYRRDEIGDLARDFDRMTVQLKKLLESQRQLLSDVSHELRSPLARLQAALGLLQKRVVALPGPEWPVEARLVALQRIEQEADKMNALIGQILSLSRLDARSAEVSAESFELSGLLQSIVDDANFEARQQRVFLLDSEPREVSAYRDLLTSAIENVIRNALKYSPESQPIEVRLTHHAATSEIQVCDHGPGVPEAQLETIFEAFTRLDEARQSGLGGHGIGLALARKIMQKHGGSITAQNRQSGGLCISLMLPLAPHEASSFQ